MASHDVRNLVTDNRRQASTVLSDLEQPSVVYRHSQPVPFENRVTGQQGKNGAHASKWQPVRGGGNLIMEILPGMVAWNVRADFCLRFASPLTRFSSSTVYYSSLSVTRERCQPNEFH